MENEESRRLIDEFLMGKKGNEIMEGISKALTRYCYIEGAGEGPDKIDSAKKKDYEQEVIIKLIGQFRNLNPDDPIENPIGWAVRVAQNHCLDQIREEKRRSRQIKKASQDGSSREDMWSPEAEIDKKEIEEMSAIEQLKTHDIKLYVGAEFSLDHVGLIWDIKKGETFHAKKYLVPTLKTKALLNQVQEIFRPPTDSEIDSLYRKVIKKENVERLKRWGIGKNCILSSQEKANVIWDHFHSNPKTAEYELLLHRMWIRDRHEHIWETLKKLIKHVDDKITETDSIYRSMVHDPEFFNFYDQIPNIRINPGKLLFRVWRRVLRKGKYTSLTFIERLMLDFKRREAKRLEKVRPPVTEKLSVPGLFFEFIDEPFSINQLRKKYDENSKNQKLYEQLSDYIYRKSFIEMKSPWWWRTEYLRKLLN